MAKVIMGVELEQRRDTATEVQEILTDYGCFIKTRLGLHQASDNREVCSEKGLIILEFIIDADKEATEMQEKLEKVEGVVVKQMAF